MTRTGVTVRFLYERVKDIFVISPWVLGAPSNTLLFNIDILFIRSAYGSLGPNSFSPLGYMDRAK